jgi:PAS domain S-box-containing protein
MTNSAGSAGAPEAGDEIAVLRAHLGKVEHRLATAQRLARLGDWEVDLRRGLGWWSDELCAIYGVPPGRDDITFEDFLGVVHPEDRDIIRRLSEMAVSRGNACDARYRIVRPDNEERLIQCRAEVEFDPAGKPLKIFGTAMDITEFGRLERALRESEEEYRAIFEQVPVGVTLIGLDRRFLVANPAWESMTGYTGEELANLSTLDITHPEDAASSTRFFEQVMRGELERPVFEKRYLRKNGEVLWARVNAVVVRGADGQPRFRLAIIEDISAEKEAGRRRADLQQQQRQALVREVHHRIKNTLQGAAGLLERHAAANPALGPAIDEARTRLNALAMVHGLQSGSAGTEVNLCNILRGIVDMLKPVSPAQLTFALPEGFVPIEIVQDESVPVALILNELLTNAVKHLEAGAEQPTIAVTLSTSGERAVVVVRNEPARLPAGFDLDSGAGLGTGLKLAKSLLPAQGATLRLLEPSPGSVEAVLTLSPPIVKLPPVTDRRGGPS